MHASRAATILRHLAMTAAATAAVAVAGGVPAAEAAPGALDLSFASGGTLLTEPATSVVEGLQVQTDGKVVVLEEGNDGNHYERVMRLLPDGTPDPSFGGGDGIAEPLASPAFWTRAFALAPNGKMLVAGYNNNDFALARLMPDGSLDPSFDGDSGNGDGIVHTPLTPAFDDPKSVTVDKQGRIVVAGNAGTDIGIARYLPDGKLDTSFAGDGTFVDATPATEHVAGLVTVDGGLVVAGQSGADTLVARYTEQGAVDTGFGTVGRKVVDVGAGQQDWADSVAVQSDGTIVLGVDVYGQAPDRLFAFTSGGAPDTSFAGDGSAPIDFQVNSLAIAADDTIVAAGWGLLNDDNAFAVERYNAGGTPDAAFGGGATVLTRPAGMDYDIADFVALGPDRRPVLAGVGSTPDGLLIARYLADPDPPNAPDPGTTQPAGATQPPAALSLSGLRLTRRMFMVGRAPKRGTAFVFTVNRVATVTIRVKRLHHKAKRMTLKRSSVAGHNRIRFTGRVGHRTLRPGRYRATVAAIDGAGMRSKTKAVTFRIVHG